MGKIIHVNFRTKRKMDKNLVALLDEQDREHRYWIEKQRRDNIIAIVFTALVLIVGTLVIWKGF